MEESLFLATVPLFAELGPSELAAVSRRLRKRLFQRGELLFSKGEPGGVMYLIKSGRVRVFMTSQYAHEVSVAVLSEGDALGEMAILDDRPRSASAIALEDTETLTISRGDFLAELATNPRIAEAVIKVLVGRLRQADELVEDLAFLDVPGRVARRLLELAQSYGKPTSQGISIELRLTQRDLASLMGATRETVNRVMAHYQKMGLISVEREHVTILKPGELERRIR